MTKLQRSSNLRLPPSRTTRLVLGFWSFIGAWTLGSWSFAATPSAPTSAPPPEPPALSRIVSRLSTAASRSGRDWAEFARETVTWGSRLQSSQEQVPEGPVRDALTAVDLGSQLDPKTADWPKLRQELEALLQKPEEPPPQENQDQKNQDDQQKQDQQNQDPSQDQQQKQNSSDQQQNEQQQQKDSGEKQDPQNSENQQQKQPPENQEDQSAFGDMEEKNIPPPPEETQQVGGAPERKEGTPQPIDPNLALPLQKLEQLKNQDSPAELFQLMEDPSPDTPRKTKKDW